MSIVVRKGPTKKVVSPAPFEKENVLEKLLETDS
jgi:hypothetical protein